MVCIYINRTNNPFLLYLRLSGSVKRMEKKAIYFAGITNKQIKLFTLGWKQRVDLSDVSSRALGAVFCTLCVAAF